MRRFLRNEEKTTISCQNLLFPSWPDQRGKRNSKRPTKYLPKKHLIHDVDGACKGLDNWRPKPNTWNNNNSTSKKRSIEELTYSSPKFDEKIANCSRKFGSFRVNVRMICFLEQEWDVEFEKLSSKCRSHVV